jgi:hypothetical protein
MEEKTFAMTIYSSDSGFGFLNKPIPEVAVLLFLSQIWRGAISKTAKLERIECLSCFHKLLRFSRAFSLHVYCERNTFDHCIGGIDGIVSKIIEYSWEKPTILVDLVNE